MKFDNTGTALSTVNNNITMTSSNRFADGYANNGVFKFTGNWWFKTFVLASGENNQATLTKGAFDLGAWDACEKLGDVTAGSTGGAYTLENPSGNGRASMRFILATGGSTADNLVPLLVSEAYRTIRTGAVISVR